ncbi:MAG: 16S rRNA (adenine(1518)-N(6)/adenine(1519)-N(6))-dimethyltransferase RsmA, partial [Candidatus Omnitrophica bacterium]|nr:16S rRNA (adenine(1518)-N(6)/adenine(1519)-N(6))-dimethyltransferase RsmA [Candidatus Omnitrophota bacterium]
LKEDFKHQANVEIIHRDILKFDIGAYFKQGPVKVIGNVPYYISSDIIEYLLKNLNYIDDAYLMLQKEYARRLVAEAGSSERGSLSCFVQFFTEPQILFLVKKGSFRPAPKVDSAFVRLKIRKQPAFSLKDEKFFFKLIRTSFTQRRKTLKNSLIRLVPEARLRDYFRIFHLNANIRPQEMRLEDFANLANYLSSA